MSNSRGRVGRATRLLVGAAVLVAAVASLTATASAAPCYTDCTSTTPPPPPFGAPSCGLSATSGHVGESVTATVSHVTPGTQVQLTVNGQVVGSATAEAQANGDGTAIIRFTVPDLPDGHYAVAAVGPGVDATCSKDGVEGLSVTRAGGGGGGLAFTGVDAALLLAVALVLLVAGRVQVESSRRRRQAVAGRPTDPARR